MKKTKEQGITLIALAITIIVLLILAGIAISSLMSNNGILKQSKTAASQHKIEEYRQELTLKLLEAQLDVMKIKLPADSSYVSELRTNLRGKIEATNNYEDLIEGTTDDVLFESVTTQKEGYQYQITSSEVIYIEGTGEGNGTFRIVYAGIEGATFETKNSTKYTSETETFTLTNPTKYGYIFLGWTGTGITEISKNVTIEKGSEGNRSYTATWKVDPITWPTGKNFDSVVIGDVIEIGGESFTVIDRSDTEVKTIPHYNITLDTNNPTQTTSPSNHVVAFCSSSDVNWRGVQTINMKEIKSNDQYKNNIQKYIDAYESKLQKIEPNITARAGLADELGWAAHMTNDLRNPGHRGDFWEATSYGDNCNRYIREDGSEGGSDVGGTSGVRPIVLIKKYTT